MNGQGFLFCIAVLVAIVLYDYNRWVKAGPKDEKMFDQKSLMYYWYYGFMFQKRINATYALSQPFKTLDAAKETVTVTNDKIVFDASYNDGKKVTVEDSLSSYGYSETTNAFAPGAPATKPSFTYRKSINFEKKIFEIMEFSDTATTPTPTTNGTLA